MLISWLIAAGLSEAKSVMIGTWLRRNLAAILIVLGSMALSAYLVHKGGEWREAEIRKEWSAKFAAIDEQSRALASERSEMESMIADRVRDALDKAPKVLPPLIDCNIPIDAIKRYNRIK